jgi:2-amino-4-hydroxy-6-hydroxymethyldihydropteridine diphosphokinase
LIYLAIGSNLPTEVHGDARQNCATAITLLGTAGISVTACSPWYESAPMPASEQPNFVNGVAGVRCDLSPHALLEACQAIENRLGRVRPAAANAARTLDIDIIDWDGVRLSDGLLEIPHPRLAERLFVLGPLRDIAPDWRHPVTGIAIAELVAALGNGQKIRRLR